jgi:hypothetical protein
MYPMAKGGEGVVTEPTLFMAGEAGPERYKFSPLSGSSNNEAFNITINYPVIREGADIEALGEQIVRSIRTKTGLRI